MHTMAFARPQDKVEKERKRHDEEEAKRQQQQKEGLNGFELSS